MLIVYVLLKVANVTGKQKFSVVHVNDAAAAYVAAVEKAPSSGIFNVVGEQGLTMQELATAVSKKLSKEGHNFAVSSITGETAKELFHWMAFLFTINTDSDNSKAKRDFDWHPKRTSGFLGVVES